MTTQKTIFKVFLTLLLLLVGSSVALAIGSTGEQNSTVAAPSNFTTTYVGNFTDITVGGPAGLHSAYGAPRSDKPGYIHVMNITETSQTKRWIGYVGNVSGELALADASGNQLYDWALTVVSGEIYAHLRTNNLGSSTTNTTLQPEAPLWSELQCANKSMILTLSNLLNHTGAGQPTFYDDNFNDTWRMDDSYANFTVANITFNSNQNGTNNSFTITYSEGEWFGNNYTNNMDSCPNINLLTNTNQNNDNDRYGSGNWDEVVLAYYDDNGMLAHPAAYDFIFVGLLANNQNGFNAAPYDYQLILPEVASNNVVTEANKGILEYVFYMELA